MKPIPNSKRKKTPWPTKAAMEQVYEKKLWGGGTSNFYSGNGSHDLEIVQPYLQKVTSFLNSFQSKLSICDLGCGDFNVGKELVPFAKKYIAVDIVEDLVVFNQEKFKNEKVEFQCLDIATAALPQGDCAIVRQVLQHLSNTEILQVVQKLSNFKYVILTEHIPNGNFVPNKDIISGQGIRLKKNSGVDLLAAPFSFQVKKEKELLSLVLEKNKGRIKTTLYTTK